MCIFPVMLQDSFSAPNWVVLGRTCVLWVAVWCWIWVPEQNIFKLPNF